MTDPTFPADVSAARARAPEAELRAWLALALEACDVADAIALDHFRRDLVLERKPDRTFVTVADRGIERELRARIRAAYPEHGLVGEEYGTEDGDAATRWFLDPIDGTHNFIRGVPVFATLIGVERDGELQVGVMSAPALDERWWALRGGGAWRRGADGEARRIRVSEVGAVGDAQLVYGSYRDNVESGILPGFPSLVADAWRDRGFGDFWGYALVAEGAAEAMMETGMHPWDLAAPLVILEEAGGRLTDVHGERRIDGGSSVASNGHLHDTLLRRLREADA